MRTNALIMLCLLGAASNAVAQPPPPVRVDHLVCGSAVRLDVSSNGRVAIVGGDDGSESLLRRTGSRLGNHYEGEGIALLRSGNTIIYMERDGRSFACAPLPR
jgi:hypothetical protein